MYVKLVFKFLQKDVSLSIDLWRHKFLGKILLSAYLGWNTFCIKKEYRKNEIFDCSFTVVQMILFVWMPTHYTNKIFLINITMITGLAFLWQWILWKALHPLVSLLVDQVLSYPFNILKALCWTDIELGTLGTRHRVDDSYQFWGHRVNCQTCLDISR